MFNSYNSLAGPVSRPTACTSLPSKIPAQKASNLAGHEPEWVTERPLVGALFCKTRRLYTPGRIAQQKQRQNEDIQVHLSPSVFAKVLFACRPCRYCHNRERTAAGATASRHALRHHKLPD